MKKRWQIKKLGDVCSLLNRGISPAYLEEGGVCVLNQKCVRDHEVSYEPSRRHDSKAKKVAEERFIQLGDVLVNSTGTGTLGRVAQVRDEPEEATTVDSHVSIVRPKPGLFHLDFFGYMLVVIEDAIKEAGEGCGGQTELARSVLAERFSVSYPESLAEQQRIVGLLDEAFEGLATAKDNAEKNLQNARALFESHLHSVFTQRGPGWVEKRLGDLSRINYGYTESASFEKVGPHFLRITDIQDNGVDWDTVPYCPIGESDLPKYKLADGDIVFARTGATTGKSYLVINPPESVCASYLIRVQLSDKELLPQFVNLFFQTHSYWEIIRAGVSGSAQGGFNATKLGELVIPFPKSSKEQMSVIAKLEKLTAETQRLARLYERKLAALEALKKSLLHQAFSGEL